MEVIARVTILKKEIKNRKEEKLCRKVVEMYKLYIVDEDEYSIRLHIPKTLEGCMKLVDVANEICAMTDKLDPYATPCMHALPPNINYTKKDYRDAPAYLVRFGGFVYGYDEEEWIEKYYTPCCEVSHWYDGGGCGIQTGNYYVPKSQFRNKKYVITDMYDYAVNDDVKQLMLEHGAQEEDFLPILTKAEEIVFWQLTPKHTIYGMGETNGWKKIKGCRGCGKETYLSNDYDCTRITPEIVGQLKAINRTSETFGRSFQPEIIINKELYTALKKEYPRMHFEPILLKEE